MRAAEAMSQANYLGKCMEEIMRAKRNVIAPALLALGTVGSILAGPVMALTTAVAPSAATVAMGTVKPFTYYQS